MKRLTGLLLAGLLPAACAQSPASTPAIWRVSDADNSLYLLGSFHALQASDYPLSSAVDAAYADAEKLAFELSPAQMQSPELVANMQKAGTLPAGDSLQSRLPEALGKALSAWLKDNPAIPPGLLEQAEPWYAALLIGQVEMLKRGLRPEQGLDTHFMELAGKDRKAVAGLEQASQQIALFDGMDEAVQLQLLQESLESGTDAGQELQALHEAWKTGDAAALEALAIAEFQGRHPALYRRINTDRNLAWLPQLQAMLDAEPEDDVLVVVGAMHLLGPDGLVQLLQKRGYRVERLR